MTRAIGRWTLTIRDRDLFPTDALSARLAEARDGGAYGVELPLNAPPVAWEQVADSGVRVAVLRRPESAGLPRLAAIPPEDREEALSAFESDLEGAAGAGCGTVTVRPANPRRPASAFAPLYEDVMHSLYRSLLVVARLAERSGVQVAVEVAREGFLLSPVEVCELLDRVNSPWIGACVDVEAVRGFSVPADWFATLGRRLRCIRLGAVEPDSTLEVWLAALAGIQFEGPLVCENLPDCSISA